MYVRLVELGVPQGLLHRLHRPPEQVGVELLEPRPRHGRVEVDALEQRVDLDVGLRRGGEGPLGPLAGGPQAADGPLVSGQVLLVLPLELRQKMIHLGKKSWQISTGISWSFFYNFKYFAYLKDVNLF